MAEKFLTDEDFNANPILIDDNFEVLYWASEKYPSTGFLRDRLLSMHCNNCIHTNFSFWAGKFDYAFIIRVRQNLASSEQSSILIGSDITGKHKIYYNGVPLTKGKLYEFDADTHEITQMRALESSN